MPLRQSCVFCRRREVDDRFRPFCSERCKMADLGRWLTGDYRVAEQPAPDAASADLDDGDHPVDDEAGSIR